MNARQNSAAPPLDVRQTETSGLVAILDALGAAAYSGAEVQRFLRSRELVLTSLDAKAEDVLGRINRNRIRVFTFNDTVVVVYETEEAVNLHDVEAFCVLLRKFVLDSLKNHILFRGALSLGQFYAVDDETNTVMGPAVSDAAAWYDRADWIGINATPQATIQMQVLLQGDSTKLDRVIVDYDVPLKDRSPLKLKAINWPKGFFVKGLRPEGGGSTARAKLLSLLAQHQVPNRTETKYFHAISFFEYVVRTQQLEKATISLPGAAEWTGVADRFRKGLGRSEKGRTISLPRRPPS